MKRSKAEDLLRKPIESMSLEQLQKHRVGLTDAIRESEAEYGFEQAVRNGFYRAIASESASGFVPTNFWLTHNLNTRLNEVLAKEAEIYKTFTD